MQKTFYQRWNDNEPGYTNLGSFATSLMETYRLADNTNREILNTAFPGYFIKLI